MDKIKLGSLYILTTRKCNLNCPHCYLGTPNDTEISEKTVDALFSQISYIKKLYLSGGEITLSLDKIEYIYHVIKEKNITVEQVTFGTNGMIYSEKLVELFKNFSNIVIDHCKLRISTDRWHYLDIVEELPQTTKNFVDKLNPDVRECVLKNKRIYQKKLSLNESRQRQQKTVIDQYRMALRDYSEPIKIPDYCNDMLLPLGNAKINKQLIKKYDYNVAFTDRIEYCYIDLDKDLISSFLVFVDGRFACYDYVKENSEYNIGNVYNDIPDQIKAFNLHPKVSTIGRIAALLVPMQVMKTRFEAVKYIISIRKRLESAYLSCIDSLDLSKLTETENKLIKKTGDIVKKLKIVDKFDDDYLDYILDRYSHLFT